MQSLQCQVAKCQTPRHLVLHNVEHMNQWRRTVIALCAHESFFCQAFCKQPGPGGPSPSIYWHSKSPARRTTPRSHLNAPRRGPHACLRNAQAQGSSGLKPEPVAALPHSARRHLVRPASSPSTTCGAPSPGLSADADRGARQERQLLARGKQRQIGNPSGRAWPTRRRARKASSPSGSGRARPFSRDGRYPD